MALISYIFLLHFLYIIFSKKREFFATFFQKNKNFILIKKKILCLEIKNILFNILIKLAKNYFLDCIFLYLFLVASPPLLWRSKRLIFRRFCTFLYRSKFIFFSLLVRSKWTVLFEMLNIFATLRTVPFVSIKPYASAKALLSIPFILHLFWYNLWKFIVEICLFCAFFKRKFNKFLTKSNQF